MEKGAGVTDYWKGFWEQHSASSREEHPQRQVLRTLDKKPVSDSQFQDILEHVEKSLRLTPQDVVLDLCCGNGLFATFLAGRCRRVIGVDFARELVAQVDRGRHPNVWVSVGDVRTAAFRPGSFDKALLYAGLQYLSHQEAVGLLERAITWLGPGGVFLIGDIPDQQRIWNFFDSQERERAYFEAVKVGKPIVGTWFESGWLERLGRHVGFDKVEVLRQSVGFPFAHYRFDLRLERS